MSDLERMYKLYRESAEYSWRDPAWKHNYRRRVNRLGKKYLPRVAGHDRNAIVMMYDNIVYRNWGKT